MSIDMGLSIVQWGRCGMRRYVWNQNPLTLMEMSDLPQTSHPWTNYIGQLLILKPSKNYQIGLKLVKKVQCMLMFALETMEYQRQETHRVCEPIFAKQQLVSWNCGWNK